MRNIDETYYKYSSYVPRINFLHRVVPFSKVLYSLGRWLVDHLNWQILLVITLLSLILESLDHLNLLNNDIVFYTSQAVLVMLFFSASVLLLKFMKDSLADRAKHIRLLAREKDLTAHLAGAVDDQETYRAVLNFASSTVPAAEAALYLFEEKYQRMDLVAGGAAKYGFCRASDADCLLCLNRAGRSAHPLAACPMANRLPGAAANRSTCLAIKDSARLVGMLVLTAPGAQQPTNEQVELLESVQAEVARALAAVQEKKKRIELELAQAKVAVQMDIARYLHDTLSQNIAYLRLVLEYMEEMNSRERAKAREQIRQMHAVAEETYEMVRGTLAVLQSDQFDEVMIQDLLTNHARIISGRCGIPIQVCSWGASKSIPSKIIRQVFYIFREALNNVEKHSQAKQVHADLLMEENRLTLSITDDGIGFDPDDRQKNGHYGLEYMRAQVQELAGQFALCSLPGKGTNITIRLPIPV